MSLQRLVIAVVPLFALAFLGAAAACADICEYYTAPVCGDVNTPQRVCVNKQVDLHIDPGCDTDHCYDATETWPSGELATQVTWTFVPTNGGPPLSGTGSPPAFDQPGKLKGVVAFYDSGTPLDDCLGDPCCQVPFEVEVVCCPQSSSAPQGGTGQSTVRNSASVAADFTLGPTGDGGSAGDLYFGGKYPSSGLWQRSGLRYSLAGSPPSGVQVVLYGDGSLHQVGTDLVVTNIADITGGYAIKYYYLDGTQVHWDEQAGEYVFGTAEDFIRYEVTSSSATSGTITKILGSTATEYHAFTGTSATRNWTLVTGTDATHPLKREELSGQVVNSVYVRTRTLKTWQNNEWYTTYEEQTDHADADAPWTHRYVDPSGLNLHTERAYYTSGNGLGLLKCELRPDGSWTWYEYNSNSTMKQIVAPWMDQSFTDPPTSGNRRVVAYDYTPQDQNDPGTLDSYRPRTVTETAVTPSGSAVTAKTFYAYYLDQGARTEVQKRCTTADASYTATSNLTTTTVYRADDDTKVASVTHPDGRKDIYDYSTGAFGGVSNPTFGGSGDCRQTLVSHEGPTGPLNNSSTQDATITAACGRVVAHKTWGRTGGAWQLIHVTTRDYDFENDEATEYRLDPNHFATQITQTVSTGEGCGCSSSGSYTVADETGLVTKHYKDALGRPTSTVVVGVPVDGDYAAQDYRVTRYEYGYDTQTERTFVRTKVGHADSEQGTPTDVLVSQKEYDKAGRLVREKTLDPGDLSTLLETQYEYARVTNGGMEVTKTRPDGKEEVTTTYCDGRTVSVTSDGVVDQFYGYEVNTDGSQKTTVATGTSLNGAARKLFTTYDLVGRVKKEQRPGYDTQELQTTEHFYDSYGRLEKVSRPGLADTLYEYDTNSRELVRTVFDVDPNNIGTIVDNGDDRITKTTTDYYQESNEWWWRTTTEVWPTAGSGTSKTVETRSERLTGFSGVASETRVQDVKTNVTITTRTIDRTSKLVTDTVDYPDTTTNQITVTRNGLVQTVQSRSNLTSWYYCDGIGRQTGVKDPRGNETTTTYDDAGRVDSVTNERGDTTTYTYCGLNEQGAGQVKTITQTLNSVNKVTRYSYDALGRVAHVWGDVPQPMEYEYVDLDESIQGGPFEKVTLKTYRGGSGWAGTSWPSSTGDPEVTVWTYDPATGLLTQKESQGESGNDPITVGYSYTPEGRLDTRTWDRNVTTTYAYYDGANSTLKTGELKEIDYDDGTPSVSYTYTRLGRLYQVTDAAGLRTFAYNTGDLELDTETFANSSLFSDKVITYDYASTSLAVRRKSGLDRAI
jgi:YD repeat-containing protein